MIRVTTEIEAKNVHTSQLLYVIAQTDGKFYKRAGEIGKGGLRKDPTLQLNYHPPKVIT